MVTTVDNSLSHLHQSIADVDTQVIFKDDWDNNGAKAINPKIRNRATQFLLDYASFTENIFNIVIEEPMIGACPDGSIDLSWRNETARMLINIRNTEIGKAYFYGDEYDDKNSIKGNVEIGKVQTHLAAWMCILKK